MDAAASTGQRRLTTPEVLLLTMIGAILFLSLLAAVLWLFFRAGYCLEPPPRESAETVARAQLDSAPKDSESQGGRGKPRGHEEHEEHEEHEGTQRPFKSADCLSRALAVAPASAGRARRSKLRFRWELMSNDYEMGGAERA